MRHRQSQHCIGEVWSPHSRSICHACFVGEMLITLRGSCGDWPARLAAMDDLIERPRLPRHWASASLGSLLRVRARGVCTFMRLGAV